MRNILVACFSMGLFGQGCAFLSTDYPCLQDKNCPTPMACVEGTCRDPVWGPTQAPGGNDAGDLAPQTDAGPLDAGSTPDAGAQPEDDAGAAVPEDPDAGAPVFDAGPDLEPDPQPEPGAPTAREAVFRVPGVAPGETPTPVSLDLEVAGGDGPFTFTVVEAPAHVTLEEPFSATAAIVPQPGFEGTDRFVWSVSGAGGTAEAIAWLEIVRERPTASALLEVEPLDTDLDAPRLLELTADEVAAGGELPGDLSRLSLRDRATGLPVPWSLEGVGSLTGTAYLWVRPSAGSGLLELSLDEVAAGRDAPAVFSEYESVWHLADGADALDVVPGTPTGTLPGFGMCGPALNFTSLSMSRVALGTGIDLLRDAPAATLSAWIQPLGATPSRGVIFAASVGSGSDLEASRVHLEMQSDRRLEVMARAQDASSPWRLETVDPVLTSNTWTHITLTLDFGADRVRLYVNGERVDLRTPSTGGAQGGPPPTTGFSGSSTSDTLALTGAIGSQDDGSGEHFVGTLDEVRVAERELTESEVLAHYLGAHASVFAAGPRAAVLAEGNAVADAVSLSVDTAAALDADLLLVAVHGEGAGLAEVTGLGLTFVPSAICEGASAPSGRARMFWARGGASAPGSSSSAVEIVRGAGAGPFAAAVIAVRRAVVPAPGSAVATGVEACGGEGAALFEEGGSPRLAVEVLEPALADALGPDVTVLVERTDLLVVTTTTPASAAEVLPPSTTLSGYGAAVGIR